MNDLTHGPHGGGIEGIGGMDDPFSGITPGAGTQCVSVDIVI